jgi:hypothetical protein
LFHLYACTIVIMYPGTLQFVFRGDAMVCRDHEINKKFRMSLPYLRRFGIQ